MKAFKAVALFIVMYMFFVPNVLADDTSLGRTPDGVYPIENTDIEMVDEIVDIYVEEGKVECKFTFKNIGNESKVLMGFPADLDELYKESSPGEHKDGIIKNFTAFDGEKELKVKLDNTSKIKLKDSGEKNFYDKWYTFEVPFKKGETKIIQNTYEFTAPVCAVGPGLIRTGYILDTGAAWKNTIGHAKVIFHLNGIEFTRIYSLFPFNINELTLDKDKLIFEKNNFDPDFNLELEYWVDQGNLDEDNLFDEQLNYLRHTNKNKYFELINSNNIEYDFKQAVSEEDDIGILYLLNKINISDYETSSPEIKEISIDNDRRISLCITDLSGDIESVKYQICSLRNPNIIFYENEDTIDENNIEGFGIKKIISREDYKEKNDFKLKISVIDYKKHELNYESDIYFNGNLDELAVNNIETSKSNNNDSSAKISIVLYLLIGILVIFCIIQQIRIYKLKNTL